jgi:lipopolysaccharide biosynthesis regulator YciM
MMLDNWQFLLVFTAIAIGWWLGRRSSVVANDDPGGLHHQHYKGLNFLLNDQPDNALDAFIEALEVNSETLETHVAVGNLMRRKGEVDRAIRIHQNLLARPSLPREYLHQAHLELARDFISAGLLDRAERLLQDLLKEAPELKEIALRHLMEIYQDEKEWQQAIDIGRQLLPKRSLLKSTAPADKTVIVALSHYSCELAELLMGKNDYHAARAQLKQALNYDRNCVRASLLIADIEYKTEHFSRAVKGLRKVRDQDSVFIPETLSLLRSCGHKLGDEEGFHRYLVECLEDSPSATILLNLVEDITAKQGDLAASEFLGKELKRRPSLRGLSKLVELHIANSSGRSKENLSILQLLIEQLTQNKPQYQCRHCGFSGKRLHWLCPSCKQWGRIKAIRGAEGD